MHIKLEDQDTGATLTLCVDRSSQVCTVLRGAEELLPQALQLAASLKAPALRIVVAASAVSEFEAHGWTVTNFVVLERKLGNGKGYEYEQTPESLVRTMPPSE